MCRTSAGSVCFRRFDNQRSDHGLYTTIYEFDDDRKLPRSGGFAVADEAECWSECEAHPVCRSARFEKTRATENCWLKRLEFMVDETEDDTDVKYSMLAPCDFQIPAGTLPPAPALTCFRWPLPWCWYRVQSRVQTFT